MNIDEKQEELHREDLDKGDPQSAKEKPVDVLVSHPNSALRTVLRFWRGFLTGVLASFGGM